MMQELKFFLCKHCGNLVAMVHNSGVPIICCGEPMVELKPGTVDASLEKHVPVISTDEGTVTVKIGSVAHPMIEAHYIIWICLETKKGWQIKYLAPGEAPEATFAVGEDTPVSAYAYCNLHGLWKTEV